MLAVIGLIAISTSGCATNPIFKDDCDWAKPIRPSRSDVLTDGTKRQILAHNEAGQKLCGWKP
jgi:hypothetical protein